MDDVAPTVLYALGVPVPTDMDGKVLVEAFSADHLRDEPVVREDVQAKPVAKARSLSEEEEQIVTERLKALGYLS